jgi:hypothetical protein
MQAKVYDKLHGKNQPDVFGSQVIGNEMDEVLGFNDRLLIGAVDMTIEEIVDRIHKLNGLAIASHVDRESYSVISQLGFIPEALKFEALELSQNISYKEARSKYPGYLDYVMINNSDAHFIDDVGRRTTDFIIEQPTFNELAKALKKEDGRSVRTPTDQ